MAQALSLTPLIPASLPTSPEELSTFKSALLAASTSLIASLPDSDSSSSSKWTKGKTYNSIIDTHSNPSPPGSGPTLGFKWHSRSSRHDDIRFDEMRDGLLVDHSLKEKEYIHDCVEAKRVQVIEEGVLEIWLMRYHLPFPTTNRDFLELILTVDATTDPTRRSFQVVSIPFQHPDAPERKGWVRAKYVSVEEVTEEEDGKVLWKMATASDAAGSIPKLITEMAMAGKIAEDPPSFITWAKKKRQE